MKAFDSSKVKVIFSQDSDEVAFHKNVEHDFIFSATGDCFPALRNSLPPSPPVALDYYEKCKPKTDLIERE